MAKPFNGVVNMDITQSTPDWGPYAQPVAPAGSPNVLFIVWTTSASRRWSRSAD